jgi:transposase
MPATTAPSITERFTVPWDLSDWADKDELLTWIDQNIAELDWANVELTEMLQTNPRFQPRFFLTLLTYAYALGICESEEIASLYYRDVNLRRLFSGQEPAASDLSKFRRENRGLLKWSLTELFKQIVRRKFELGQALMPAGLRRYLLDVATARLDIARNMDRSAHGAL